MRKLFILLGLFIAQSILPTIPLHKQLETAAQAGELTAMKQLLTQGASCTPFALSGFFRAIAAKQEAISEQAVAVATQLFPRIGLGIDGKSAVNQSSCINVMAGRKRLGFKNHLPLTWMIENYPCEGNAQAIVDLLLKNGADLNQVYIPTRLSGKQTPMQCAQASLFTGWVAYLKERNGDKTQ